MHTLRKSTYDVYCDSGHSWIKVHYSILDFLNIVDSLSHCSYINGEYAFLEGKYDAAVFIKALDNYGIKFRTREHYTAQYSKIRSYVSYNIDSMEAHGWPTSITGKVWR